MITKLQKLLEKLLYFVLKSYAFRFDKLKYIYIHTKYVNTEITNFVKIARKPENVCLWNLQLSHKYIIFFKNYY